MKNSRKSADQETRELIETPLLIPILVVVGVCIITAFTLGTVVAAPLSALSFFFLSRWDRLRESKKVTFDTPRAVLSSTRTLTSSISKTSVWNIFSTNLLVFLIQFIFGLILGVLAEIFVMYINSIFRKATGSTFRPDSPASFFDMGEEEALVMILVMYPLSFITCGWFSARHALRNNLSPYRHAILSCLIFISLSNIITTIAYFYSKGEFYSISIPAFVVAIILSIIGAKIAIKRAKISEHVLIASKKPAQRKKSVINSKPKQKEVISENTDITENRIISSELPKVVEDQQSLAMDISELSVDNSHLSANKRELSTDK